MPPRSADGGHCGGTLGTTAADDPIGAAGDGALGIEVGPVGELGFCALDAVASPAPTINGIARFMKASGTCPCSSIELKRRSRKMVPFAEQNPGKMPTAAEWSKKSGTCDTSAGWRQDEFYLRPDCVNERTNALAMLTAAHREVEAMFEQFDAATPDRQMVLRIEIAATLSHHQLLESRIFFPAARTALDSSELLDAAAVENATTEFLLTRVVDDCASIELVRATMSVLRDHVARHVENEERYIFRRLRASNLDLDALGARMQAFSAACA